jgi:hypothetical protein
MIKKEQSFTDCEEFFFKNSVNPAFSFLVERV